MQGVENKLGYNRYSHLLILTARILNMYVNLAKGTVDYTI